ncbi:UNVERIFIED_ORG: MFS family permease [Microbispora rosea subsp. rosea]
MVPAAAVVLIYTVVMAGGTLTIPLYVLWASKFGFGPVATTLVFIAYVIGVVGTLLVAGSLSDAIGRRPVLVLALALRDSAPPRPRRHRCTVRSRQQG